jgi:hypothetical protein
VIRPRRLGAYALVVYFIGLISGTIANGLFNAAGINATPIIPFSDIFLMLGIVFAIAASTMAGASMKSMIVVGIILGFGIFYVGEPHEVHIASGFGLGLSHFPGHILLGESLITIATVIAAALSFRAKGSVPTQERVPSGSNP